jgi:hypothetical protein
MADDKRVSSKEFAANIAGITESKKVAGAMRAVVERAATEATTHQIKLSPKGKK